MPQAQLSHDQLVHLTQQAFRLLGDWSIPKDMHPVLLGLEPSLRKRHINRYRLGTPLPVEGDSYQRIQLLLKIENMLHKMFPHSVLSANLWVTTPNLRYGRKTPLDTMLRGGLEGIRRVEKSIGSLDHW